jgi:hypothetical protein
MENHLYGTFYAPILQLTYLVLGRVGRRPGLNRFGSTLPQGVDFSVALGAELSAKAAN